MFENKKFQLRLSEELFDYCKNNNDNMSLFIREAIREKIDSGLLSDSSLAFVEVRARTPYTYFAKLINIVDGDTLYVEVDLGFSLSFKTKIRLAGIDTAPIDTPEGQKAIDFLNKELNNSSLLIETRKKEKFGRYLAFVYYSKQYSDFEDIIRFGKLINEELVKSGLANVYKD